MIAVVGDGAMGNGLSYEALNHIGDYQKPLIIILNDNRMSINPNVGALHNSLERIRLHRGYRSAKSRTKAALRRIPVVGEAMVHGVEQVKEDLKRLYLRDGALFEEMGITYYGPVNGHDLGELDAFCGWRRRPQSRCCCTSSPKRARLRLLHRRLRRAVARGRGL